MSVSSPYHAQLSEYVANINRSPKIDSYPLYSGDNLIILSAPSFTGWLWMLARLSSWLHLTGFIHGCSHTSACSHQTALERVSRSYLSCGRWRELQVTRLNLIVNMPCWVSMKSHKNIKWFIFSVAYCTVQAFSITHSTERCKARNWN